MRGWIRKRGSEVADLGTLRHLGAFTHSRFWVGARGAIPPGSSMAVVVVAVALGESLEMDGWVVLRGIGV